MFNISQATYERLHACLVSGRSFSRQDCKDILRAYEDAVELLEEGDLNGGELDFDDVHEFLYLPDGKTLRVNLDGV